MGEGEPFKYDAMQMTQQRELESPTNITRENRKHVAFIENKQAFMVRIDGGGLHSPVSKDGEADLPPTQHFDEAAGSPHDPVFVQENNSVMNQTN